MNVRSLLWMSTNAWERPSRSARIPPPAPRPRRYQKYQRQRTIETQHRLPLARPPHMVGQPSPRPPRQPVKHPRELKTPRRPPWQNHRLERVQQRRDHAQYPEYQPNRMHSASRAGIRPPVKPPLRCPVTRRPSTLPLHRLTSDPNYVHTSCRIRPNYQPTTALPSSRAHSTSSSSAPCFLAHVTDKA